ncbi:MAG: tripartite-type tricarboxylate transporter receptor subunit TctC [Alphaproteobacteria bacterium]|jgi:tripartite-type tricarboxylate transporter receptor subunit TctC
MQSRKLSILAGSLIGAAALGLAAPSSADEVADFYKGKTMTLLMSTGVGGSNDRNARILVEHLVKHLPGNPSVKAINMPGAGHVRASNYLYNRARKDGTFIGAFVRFYVLHQALGGKGVKYDATKFNYLGSTNVSNVVLGAMNTAGINTFEELKTKELIVGGTGVGSGTVIFPNLFNTIMGTKMKIVQGYKSGRTIDLAMERGEVKGRAGFTFESIVSSHPRWIPDGKFKVLTQIGLRPEPGYGHIPMAETLTNDADAKKVLKIFAGIVAVGSPIFTNQGVPKARVAALRKAFNVTMKDKAYLAATKKARLNINPTSGDDLAKIVSDIVNAPADVIAKARGALSRKGLVKCKSHTSAKYCKGKKKKKKKKS